MRVILTGPIAATVILTNAGWLMFWVIASPEQSAKTDPVTQQHEFELRRCYEMALKETSAPDAHKQESRYDRFITASIQEFAKKQRDRRPKADAELTDRERRIIGTRLLARLPQMKKLRTNSGPTL